MADAAVSYAIQKIGDAIINEALFVGSVEQQAEGLKEELTWMKSFLPDADAKARGGDKSVQAWVKLVWEAANDAEDLIESFATKVYVPGMILPCGFISKFRTRRHNFGLEIKGLKKRIKDIMESAARYGITAPPDDRRDRREVDAAISGWRAPALHASDSSHVVLMEAEKEAILDLLNPVREKRRSVVSIVGMGGLGKTTLAKKVFKDPWIQSRFHCTFWIDVSQDYNEVKLLKDLLRQIFPVGTEDYAKMEKTELEWRLYDSLLGKTYLIVMDDVWDAHVGRIIEKHLPDEGNGSKVLITTRSRTVARAADRDQAYQLRFLNKEESWELFISKAIPREEERSACTGRLKELGEQMAETCGGLPLALVVMGSLLSQKQLSITEWEVSRSMVWQYEDERQNCMRILALSYTDLPYDLKLCFLYLCAFPEDYQIEPDRLIRLWIAEGFIAERGDGLTLEETAEIQLEKLIERSLVHVVEQDHHNGIILCRVHVLLRELCISEAKQINFMSVSQGTTPLRPESLRRLSVITEPEEIISWLKSTSRLRALLGFNFHETAAMNLFLGGLKLIRVIDLEGATNLKVMPNEIGGLVNLRYLRLRGTSLEWLPETVNNLSRLQFLDVRETAIKEMTRAVWKIETLRQVFFPTNASIPYTGQGWWRSLQVLSSAAANDWMDGSLHRMMDIKTLEIWQIDAPHHKVLSLNLPKFERLKILKLQGSSIPWTALTLSDLRQLRTLVLWGRIKSAFPEEVRPESEKLELDYRWPVNLSCLQLSDSHLHRDPLHSLGQLSELRFLSLKDDVYSWGGEIKFRGVEFLQKLVLCGLQVERIVVEDGAMSRLQNLKIYDCPALKTIPPRLKDLTEWKR